MNYTDRNHSKQDVASQNRRIGFAKVPASRGRQSVFASKPVSAAAKPAAAPLAV